LVSYLVFKHFCEHFDIKIMAGIVLLMIPQTSTNLPSPPTPLPLVGEGSVVARENPRLVALPLSGGGANNYFFRYKVYGRDSIADDSPNLDKPALSPNPSPTGGRRERGSAG
jgi:hypothetical protein